jgi:hypothetical protein
MQCATRTLRRMRRASAVNDDRQRGHHSPQQEQERPFNEPTKSY